MLSTDMSNSLSIAYEVIVLSVTVYVVTFLSVPYPTISDKLYGLETVLSWLIVVSTKSSADTGSCWSANRFNWEIIWCLNWV